MMKIDKKETERVGITVLREEPQEKSTPFNSDNKKKNSEKEKSFVTERIEQRDE